MSTTVSLTDNSDLVKNAMESQIAVALERIGLAGEANAKLEVTRAVYDTPVSSSGYKRTGNLRNRLTHKPEGKRTMVIGENVEYAPYVEMGTSKMKARPYLKPAIMDHIDEYKQILEEELKN